MMLRNHTLCALTGLLCLLTVAATAPAWADIVVLESNADAFAAGQIYADDVPLNLETGQNLSIMLPSGETKAVAGPLAGKVADLTRGVKLEASVWSTVTGILQRGGASVDQAGGVRSLGSENAMTADFSWSVVPAFVEGSVCVQGGAQLEIARPPLGDVDTMTVVDPMGPKAPIRWPSDAETVPWPSQVPPAADKTYVFMVPSLPVKQVTLRFLDLPLPADAALLPALVAHGCTFQVESWLMNKIGGVAP